MRLKEEFEPDLVNRPHPDNRILFRRWRNAVERRRAEWIKALMDPEAKQAEGVLRLVNSSDGSVIGECCLGRLCTVLAEGEWVHGTINMEGLRRVAIFRRQIDEDVFENHDTMPDTHNVAQWLYVPHHVVRGFAEMNDGGKLTFRDIALCATVTFSLFPPELDLPNYGSEMYSQMDWVTNNLGERAFFKSQTEPLPTAGSATC